MIKILNKTGLSLLILGALLVPYFSWAAIDPLTRPFGGRILAVIPPNPLLGCLFPVIIVGLPVPGIFAITPLTKFYREYQVYRPGAWALGTASNLATVCAVPPAASIQIIGTSF